MGFKRNPRVGETPNPKGRQGTKAKIETAAWSFSRSKIDIVVKIGERIFNTG